MKGKIINKTIFMLALLVITIFVIRTPVFAEEKTDTIENNSIISTINRQEYKNELLEYINTYQENGNPFEYDIADNAVLRTVFHGIWYYDDIGKITDSKELIAYIDEIEQHSRFEDQKAYIVLAKEPVVVCSYIENGKVIMNIINPYEAAVPTFIQDIKNNSAIHSDEDTYSEIICIDGTNSYEGIAVYYIREDGGGTVLYYEDYESDAYEFDYMSFQTYVKGYYDYITSDENRYNEAGEALIGNMTFTGYVKKILNNELIVSEKQENKSTVFVVSIVIFIFVAAIICGIFILRAVRKKCCLRENER